MCLRWVVLSPVDCNSVIFACAATSRSAFGASLPLVVALRVLGFHLLSGASRAHWLSVQWRFLCSNKKLCVVVVGTALVLGDCNKNRSELDSSGGFL